MPLYSSIKTIVYYLSVLLLCSALNAQTQNPNILFLFADDHSYLAQGSAGNSEVKTPHLDRLANSGTVFTHAYNMGAWYGAVCVASRGMLNTGKFIWHVQDVDFGRDTNSLDRISLWPEEMKKIGYETYFSGKWHTMGEPSKLFDHCGTLRGGMPQDNENGYNRPVAGEPDPWSPSDPKFGGYWEGGQHWSEALADEGIAFIRDAAKREKPFFMYLSFNAPHDPRQAPQEFVEMYPPENLTLPDSYLPENQFNGKIGVGRESRDERLAPFPRTKDSVLTHRAEYYALVTHLDAQIGRILEQLESEDLLESTLVIYTADHGLAMGEHGLMGKQNMFDHSMRSPLIFSGPGIDMQKTIDVPVYIQDVMPTSFDLAHAPIPETVEFKSLAPLIKNQATNHYDAIYGAFRPEYQRMIMKNGMKLILYPMISEYLLYDLKKDPRELSDLSKNPEKQALVQTLFQELKHQQPIVGDSLDLDSSFPDL